MNYEQFQHPDKDIFLVNLKKEKKTILSQLARKGIQKKYKNWKNIGLIINQKWHSKWLICEECGHIPKCKNCDIPIGIHLDKTENSFGLCHICKTQYNPPSKCSECGEKSLSQYGYGIQQVQNLLENQLNIPSKILKSQTVNSFNKAQKTHQNIQKHQVLIGTSLLSTPISWYNFDLLIFVDADIGLNIPDFNSNFSTFTFLYETIKQRDCPNFIIQSRKPENYVIQNVCNLDFQNFKEKELKYRKQYNYPPFGTFCLIHYKNKIEKSLFNKVNKLKKELSFLKEKYEMDELNIYSTPPLIYKKFGKYRYNIILQGNNLNQFMDTAYSKLKMTSKWFKINRNPKSLV